MPTLDCAHKKFSIARFQGIKEKGISMFSISLQGFIEATTRLKKANIGHFLTTVVVQTYLVNALRVQPTLKSKASALTRLISRIMNAKFGT